MKKIVIPILMLCVNPTFASENNWSSQFTPDDLAMSLSSGLLLKSKAKELVYMDDQSKASELAWDTNSANIINAEINWQFHPKVSFNARGWSTLSKNSAVMNDYDWTSETDRDLLTDWSHHDRTPLNYANEFDLNFNVNLLNTSHYKLGALLGYQQNKYSWSAIGGSYHYSDVDSDGDYVEGSALSNTGEFDPNEKVIGYQQKFKMPYIGINGKFEYNKFELTTTLKYSNWVNASDHDEHYLRDISFDNKANNGTYYGAIVNAGYNIRPDTKLFTEYSWNEYKRVTTDSVIVDNETNEITRYKNGGGISNKAHSASIGVAYTF